MAVSGVLGRWNLARISLRCLPPEELYAGVPTLLGVELANHRRWLPVCLLEIALEGERVLFPMVVPGGTQRRSLTFTLNGRGWQALPALHVTSRFPINFFVRRLTLAVANPVVVFPAPRPCPGEQRAETGRDGDARWLRGRGAEGEVSRIGHYQGGEPLKHIHWRLSARQARLMVKELSAASRNPVTLDLAALPGPDLEARLGCAVFLLGRLLRAGRPVGLRAGALYLPPAGGRPHRLRLLRTLALYDREQDPA